MVVLLSINGLNLTFNSVGCIFLCYGSLSASCYFDLNMNTTVLLYFFSHFVGSIVRNTLICILKCFYCILGRRIVFEDHCLTPSH